jgi:hypothetical protein
MPLDRPLLSSYPFLSSHAAEAPDAASNSFQRALIEALSSKEGKTAKMSALGSLVKKPDGVPKLSVFLKARPHIFRVDDKSGDVSLVK